MREALAWQMFDEVGVYAPRHSYARFCINGQYFGLYGVIEQVDRGFLWERFTADNNDGNLYKGTWGDIGPAELLYRHTGEADGGDQYYSASNPDDRTYSLKTNENADDPPEYQTYDDLATFVRTINAIGLDCGQDECFDTDAYRQSVERIFDVFTFLRWASTSALLGSWDNYWATPANYYLFNSGYSGAGTEFMNHPFFHWIPWDYDNCLGIDYFGVRWYEADIVDWPESAAQAFNDSQLPLLVNLLRNQVYLQYYLDHVDYLMSTVFTENWFREQIGAGGEGGFWDLVETSARLEAAGDDAPPFTGRQFTNAQVEQSGYGGEELWLDNNHTLGILTYVQLRRASVEQQLEVWREQYPEGSSGAAFPARPAPLPGL
jgi:hypothetical protein